MAGILVTNKGKGSVGLQLNAVVRSTWPIMAEGFVRGLRPGETRAAILYVGLGVPSPDDPVQVWLVSEDRLQVIGQTAKKAATVHLANFTYQSDSGLLYQAEIDATNTGSTPLSVSVGAAFTRNGNLVGYAHGFVKDLGPGQDLIVPLQVVGEPLETDTVVSYVDDVYDY